VFGFGVNVVGEDSVADTEDDAHVSGAQIWGRTTDFTGDYHSIWGAHVIADAGNTGDVAIAIATYAQVLARAGSTIASGVCVEASPVDGGGDMDEAIGLAIGYHATHTPTNEEFDTIATNQYGVRVGRIIGGTLNYAWYSEDGAMRIGDYVEMPERGSDPAAPASNNARLYVRDNGAGKTQLVARFPTGAVQVVATEP
jgi:hypothetical protein